jgi:hypothetical protein
MDLTPLVKINENVMFAKANTSLMLQKLKDFENRLTKLDEELLPIQNVIYILKIYFLLYYVLFYVTSQSTSRLSLAKKNIGLTYMEIERTNEYFRLANESGNIVSKGPRVNFNEFFEVFMLFHLLFTLSYVVIFAVANNISMRTGCG